jgi:cytochrome c551/c552
MLASGFTVTPTAANGILLLHLVDGQGAAKSGVAGTNIVLAGATGATGPKFLDAQLAPSTATASTASGWVMFFEVPPGVVSLGQAVNATATLAMPTSPVAAGAITIANVVVTDGAPPALPMNVSFAQTVFPIFTNRGCVACHSGNGPGRQLGGLMLDGSTNLAYKELTGPENPLRVQTAMPEKSLVLTMPSAESPADGHPNVTFTGPQDLDYLKILTWIKEGAKDN